MGMPVNNNVFQTTSKTAWIINQYASTPVTGFGGRHYYLAHELAKQGYSVYLIASSANHLLNRQPVVKNAYLIEKIDGINFVWVKMPYYAEAHSKQRALNWFIFSWRLQGLTKLLSKPDTILYSSPSPIAFLGAEWLANKFKSRLLFEVRDIWPLTLTEIGGYSTNHPFIRFMQWVEDRAYRKSDAVISNLKNSVEHMISRGLSPDKFSWIPNGFSLDEVNQKVLLPESVSKQLPQGKFLVGYTGTLGVANCLDSLIDAAEKLRDYEDIVFVLVGGGKLKELLKSRAADKGLKNVLFIDTIPKVQIQAMLSRFDVCYIGWLNEKLYRFGIGANKIPEYLYSGKPILHAYSGSSDPIISANAGIQVPAEDPIKLAEAVLKFYHMPIEQRLAIGANGHSAAVRQYEYGQLSQQLAEIMFPD